jgi:large subunit ribosomal protein L24
MAQARQSTRTRIRKNDMVMVVKGRDRGKTGKVLRVEPTDGRVLVKRHSKPRGAASPGGIVEKEAPLGVANVMFFCERCNAPVRLGIRFDAEGERSRVCRRCGEAVGND